MRSFGVSNRVKLHHTNTTIPAPLLANFRDRAQFPSQFLVARRDLPIATRIYHSPSDTLPKAAFCGDGKNRQHSTILPDWHTFASGDCIRLDAFARQPLVPKLGLSFLPIARNSGANLHQ